MTHAPFPFNVVNFRGFALTRNQTLSVPVDDVRRMLPGGVELCSQSVTAPGTHPVLLNFNVNTKADWSIPSPMGSLNYHELVLCVPWTYLEPGYFNFGVSGPFLYMPVLYLDNLLALWARVFWGMRKDFGVMVVRDNDYYVNGLLHGLSSVDEAMIHLSWDTPRGKWGRPADFPLFADLKEMMSQPLLTQLPLGVGAYFVACFFERLWDHTRILPLHTSTNIPKPFVTGLPAGRFPSEGRTPTIAEHRLGSCVIDAPFELSLLYPTELVGVPRALAR